MGHLRQRGHILDHGSQILCKIQSSHRGPILGCGLGIEIEVRVAIVTHCISEPQGALCSYQALTQFGQLCQLHLKVQVTVFIRVHDRGFARSVVMETNVQFRRVAHLGTDRDLGPHRIILMQHQCPAAANCSGGTSALHLESTVERIVPVQNQLRRTGKQGVTTGILNQNLHRCYVLG